MKNNILKNMREVFADVFDNPEIQIEFETSAKDIDEWDSLMNLQIMLAIEKNFKISFTAAEIANFANVGEICDCIIKKGGKS